jgi:hypothetical protein
MADLFKGYWGVDYRTALGLQRSGAGAAEGFSPTDPAWDFYVGGLPFLLASSPERPYLRETAPIRRDRLDAARDAGEQSLDSNMWLRSWTSWHLGAGQNYAEPLEGDPEIARFRFDRSGGIDVWQEGQFSLLKTVTSKQTGVRKAVGINGVGVVCSTTGGVRVVTESTNVLASSSVVDIITASATRWYGISAAGTVLYGAMSGGAAGTALATITGATALNFIKDRLWVGAGRSLYEVSNVAAASQVAFHTFSDQTRIIDIDTGSGGVFVLVDDGLSRIYQITVNDDGTLNAPREVGVLPRGETGNFLYAYLGRYMVIGTTRGVRVADANSGQDLPIGPLIIEMAGGCLDAAANGNHVWVTAGTEGIDPDGAGTTSHPGLYRMDLSRVVKAGQAYGDTAASRYAYATDLYSTNGGRSYAVSHYGGKPWFVAGTDPTNATLFIEADTYLLGGWLETGDVTFSTAESKAWQSIIMEIAGNGGVGVFADTGSGFSAVTQTVLATPYVGALSIDGIIHPPSGSMNIRTTLASEGAESPIVRSVGIRALPSPKRNRYIRLPLGAYDHEIDRNQSPIGYEGFAYDRVKDLEALEEAGYLVTVNDTRTGESLTCQIERVSFMATTPPDRGKANVGGVVTLTLLAV